MRFLDDLERPAAVPSPLPMATPVQTGGRGEGKGEVRVWEKGNLPLDPVGTVTVRAEASFG